jgi:hypothetical protein
LYYGGKVREKYKMKQKTKQLREYRKIPELLKAPVMGLGYDPKNVSGGYNHPTIMLKPQRQRDLVRLIKKIIEESENLFARNPDGFYQDLFYTSRLVNPDVTFHVIEPYLSLPTDPLRIVCNLNGYFPEATSEYADFANKVEQAAKRFVKRGKSQLKFKSDKASVVHEDKHYEGQAMKIESAERNGREIVIIVNVCKFVEYRPKLFQDTYREELVAKVNAGGGWYCGDSMSAREELEEYDERRRRESKSGSW